MAGGYIGFLYMDFSIVIATHNRPDLLRVVLQAITASTGGSKCTVVVADNGDSGKVKDVISECAGSICKIRHVVSEPHNKSAALNKGVESADSEWLAFTDDDTIPAVGWLKEGEEYAKNSGLNIFGGRVIPGEVGTLFPSWLKAGRCGRVPKGPAIVDYEPMTSSGVLESCMQVPLGANIFVKKNIFEKYGGYDENLWRKCGKAALGCEDAEFAMRVRDRGERIGYCSEAVVLHPVYAERAKIVHHVKWAYRMGVRENIIFREESLGVSNSYLLKTLLLHFLRVLFMSVKRDSGSVVCELMCMARSAGQMNGKMCRDRGI